MLFLFKAQQEAHIVICNSCWNAEEGNRASRIGKLFLDNDLVRSIAINATSQGMTMVWPVPYLAAV